MNPGCSKEPHSRQVFAAVGAGISVPGQSQPQGLRWGLTPRGTNLSHQCWQLWAFCLNIFISSTLGPLWVYKNSARVPAGKGVWQKRLGQLAYFVTNLANGSWRVENVLCCCVPPEGMSHKLLYGSCNYFAHP